MLIAVMMALVLNTCTADCVDVVPSNTCEGDNQKCNPCVNNVCASDEKVIYLGVKYNAGGSGPCCYEESVVICVTSRECVPNLPCGNCVATGPHHPDLDVSMTLVPGAYCMPSCLN